MDPLVEILKTRNVDISQGYTAFRKTILDKVNGESDLCSKCLSAGELLAGIASGTALFNESNWDHLKGFLGLDMILIIPGNLGPNRTEDGLHKALHDMNYAVLMLEMFDSKREAYATWSRSDWVCFDCLRVFLRDTLPFWWLDRKRKAGVVIRADCKYGFDCPSQAYELDHAREYNHLCEPKEPHPNATPWG